MIRNELKNGVNFSFEQSDKFKTSMVVINFSLPLTDENAAAYSLLCEVMKRGCKTFPTYKDISNNLVDLYSSFGCYVFKKGESLCFGIYSSFLDAKFILENIDNLKQNVDFITQFIFEPLIIDGSFKKEYIEQERANLINRINEMINDKSSYAVNRCIEIMCKKERYSVPSTGKVEFVNNVTCEDLYDAYKYLIDFSFVDVYYYGSSDITSVEMSLSNLFDHFPIRNDSIYPIALSKVEVLNSQSIVEEINATQGNLVLGFRTNLVLSDNKYPAMVLYNEILGASPISKLFMNIREKNSLCYYCNSSLDSIKGIMLICSGIDNKNYIKTVEAIKEEVSRMENGDISEEELNCAKKSLLNSYKEIKDSPFSLVNWYHTRHILDIDQTPESFSESIQNVTISDIMYISKNIKLDLVYFLKGLNNA